MTFPSLQYLPVSTHPSGTPGRQRGGVNETTPVSTDSGLRRSTVERPGRRRTRPRRPSRPKRPSTGLVTEPKGVVGDRVSVSRVSTDPLSCLSHPPFSLSFQYAFVTAVVSTTNDRLVVHGSSPC